RARGTPPRPPPARPRVSRRAEPARRPGGRLDRPFPHKGDGAREGGFATLELPREAADDQPLVLELGRLDLSAQVLDMDAILREQSVVGELVRRVGEHLIDRGLAAEFLRSEERRVGKSVELDGCGNSEKKTRIRKTMR